MEKWSLRTPKKGDIIRISLTKKYYHYGIYADDNTVIQYGKYDDMLKKDAKDVEVLITTIEDVAGGKFIEVRNYSLVERLTKRSPDKIISLAMSRLGEKKYNINNNNCEHFVYECTFKNKKKI